VRRVSSSSEFNIAEALKLVAKSLQSRIKRLLFSSTMLSQFESLFGGCGVKTPETHVHDGDEQLACPPEHQSAILRSLRKIPQHVRSVLQIE
jgi:hypothetical protein